ncbi:MAG: Ig domain-containing protein [Clostridia bacterium]|jgi:uncharacterized protein YjdB|nr:Ig domain-containing protein [Clostridia bacterium]
MKNKQRKLLSIVLMMLMVVSIGLNTYAHSGRTDSSGGHKDNQNKSGLGSYHYHCGGYPAHLHTNGVCPYATTGAKQTTSSGSSSNTKTETKSNTSTKTNTNTNSKTKTETKEVTKKDTTVVATGINIEPNVQSMEIGERKTLSASVTPENTTDKTITWKSSSEEIASINENGEIVAKKNGVVDITATTTNGKSSTVRVTVKEVAKQEENVIKTEQVVARVNGNGSTNTMSKEEDGSSAVGAVAALGLLGGGGYLGYRKYGKK